MVVSSDDQGAVVDATRRENAVAPGLFQGTQFQTRQQHCGVHDVTIRVDVVVSTQPHKHVAVGVLKKRLALGEIKSGVAFAVLHFDLCIVARRLASELRRGSQGH